MKKVIAQRLDIAFYIKLYPLKNRTDAQWKAKSIVCNKSLKLLEDNFEKRAIPKIDCATKEVDDTIKFAAKHGITGTPTIVLPDGSTYVGTAEADKLIKMIDDALRGPAQKKKK